MRKETEKLPKIVVLLGPTACGKTNWSLRLSKKFNGEVISADSRQIYKQMDIGTAKEAGEWRRDGLKKTFYIQDVPHHLIDFLNPGKTFSVAEFRDRAIKHAKMIRKQDKLPIIAGGTGLYISSVIDNLYIPRVAPNKKLRNSLEEKSNEELMLLLKQMDKEAVKKIDAKNKRRIIRALEVCIFTGEPFSKQQQKGDPLFESLQIGIDVDRDVLYERIDKRVDEMIKLGLVEEVKNIVRQKYSWQLSSMNGIGYRQFRDFFDGKCTLDEAISILKRDSRRYARRQHTWFKRDNRIEWIKDYETAEERVFQFLNS
ncbi:tRNA (adenosine(37)-N6)-dimethylallyltransferase MiaA [Patescibacteria group bacterium]|nr:tRNA (adenosine(37)-N6)-dimethylallyltransferase MiaA [Patescibacteria group bacterium]MBU1895635.1 tRNA (adenosine(37)-N6)-dimethylallyltransferase MiaA [Patescibacteria group bacterium]